MTSSKIKCTRVVSVLVAVIANAASATGQDTKPVPAGFAFRQDLVYGTQSDRQRLDILLPKDIRGALPLIVHIHSGGWNSGGKGGDKTFQMLCAFAEAGYIAASIGYRFSEEAPFPAAVEDCQRAVRWLRENAPEFGIDSKRIGAIGASSGGHLAAMLAVTSPTNGLDTAAASLSTSSAIQAAVAVCAPLNLTVPLSHNLANQDDPLVTRFLGGSLNEKYDVARRASPIFHVSKSTPPLFLLHGAADNRVDSNQSIAMADALAKAGAPYKISVIEGGKHGMDIAREPKTFAEILAFFDENVKK